MDRMKELRDLSKMELEALCLDLSKEIFEMKNEMKMTQQLKHPHQIKEKRRTRARVLTLLRQGGQG